MKSKSQQFLEDFKIEKGVSAPEKGIRRRLSLPFDEMEDGDSIFVPEDKGDKNQVKYAMSLWTYNSEQAKNSRLVKRETPEGIRIWKVKR